MDKRLLDILCCPVTKSPLRFLADAALASVNRALPAGTARNGPVMPPERALPAELLTQDSGTIYPIEDAIPVMLAEEAIATSQLADFPRR